MDAATAKRIENERIVRERIANSLRPCCDVSHDDESGCYRKRY